MVQPRPTSDRGFIGQVTMFLGVSGLAGVLVAGMLIPLASSVGLSARSTAQAFNEPHENLDLQPLAQRSRILAADGKTVIAELYDENRISVPLKAVAPIMRQAIVAIEDSRFYEHGGVDLRGTLRAAATNAQSGEVLQGGSTLTQQYVKNVLVEQARNPDQVRAARERGLARKFRELQYAIQIEKELTKDQILENYLNIAYFGGGAYGVEAAARHFFGRSASKLTLPEAALLAGVVRSPSTYSPTSNPAKATARRNTVLDRMAEIKMISPAQAAQAKKGKIALHIQKSRHGCATAKEAAFFCDYVSRVIRTDPVFGKTKAEREALLARGGLNVVTTLIPKMQKAAQRGLDKHVYARDKAAGAISLVEPGTGAIRAMAQSRPYGSGGISLNVDQKYGGGNGFQAGSTFKAFVAAAALQQNIPPTTTFHAPYQIDLSDRPFKTCNGVVKSEWSPSNETQSETGTYNMATGLADSINTYFAQLEAQTGLCEPKKVAEQLGLTQATGEPLQEDKAFTLGAVGAHGVSPLAMAEAYATFAARGKHCDAVAIVSVTDRNGKSLPVPKADCRDVLKPEIADTMNAMLQGVIEHGTATSANIGRPAAGKTGTTQNRVAVWFVGYTPNMAAAVWVGSPKDYTYHLVDKKIGPETRHNWCGGCLPAPIWADAMEKALAGLPEQDFVHSSANFGIPEGAPVPDVRGATPDQAVAALSQAGFNPQMSSSFVASNRPFGTVAFTSPKAGTFAPKGSTVTIFVSRGGQASFNPSPPPGTGGGGGGGNPKPRRCKPNQFPFCIQPPTP
jgi:membrane peptidoglycan carboxypeptidase